MGWGLPRGECVRYAALGETCGGATPACASARCDGAHTCHVAPRAGPTIADLPGTCVASVCTLTGGEEVAEWWSGKDTGSNHCNTCVCVSSGFALPQDLTQAPGGAACTKELNDCNDCSCSAQGVLTCAQREVAQGWSGKDTGDNDCNTCECASQCVAGKRVLDTTSPWCAKPAPSGKQQCKNIREGRRNAARDIKKCTKAGGIPRLRMKVTSVEQCRQRKVEEGYPHALFWEGKYASLAALRGADDADASTDGTEAGTAALPFIEMEVAAAAKEIDGSPRPRAAPLDPIPHSLYGGGCDLGGPTSSPVGSPERAPPGVCALQGEVEIAFATEREQEAHICRALRAQGTPPGSPAQRVQLSPCFRNLERQGSTRSEGSDCGQGRERPASG
eukprot:gene5305-51417_t